MKKIICLILTLICITGCNQNDNILDITFSNMEDCNQKPELLVTKDDINIYTYCISNIKVNVNNKLIDLKKYIKENKNSIKNIITFLPFKTYELIDYMTIYAGEGFEISKDTTIKLAKCHTSSGNNDVYIGNVRMNAKSNFCKDNNYTFIRTYFVEDIEYDSYSYYNVKLKSVDGIVETVSISDWEAKKLEKNKTFEFELMLNDNVKNIKDNTKFIFGNSTIVDIRETTKDIKDQINEKIK